MAKVSGSVVVQDNAREKSLRQACGLLDTGENRHGRDAMDELGNFYELKTGTLDECFSTCRDFKITHLKKWMNLHWVFGNGTNYADGFVLERVYYISPKNMLPWFQEHHDLLTHYEFLANKAYDAFVHNNPDLSDQNKIMKRILNRGLTLNDPRVKMKYVVKHGIILTAPYNISLRQNLDTSPVSYDHFDVCRSSTTSLMGFFQ